MRLITLLITTVLVIGLSPAGATAAGNKLRDDSADSKAPARSVNMHAILISASDEKGDSDRRLAAYVPNLKSSLRFESFAFIGEGSGRINMPGQAEISLPRGQSVKVQAAHYGEGMVWLRVIWMDGSREVTNVVYTKWPLGKPIVAGAARAGENLAIIVTPR